MVHSKTNNKKKHVLMLSCIDYRWKTVDVDNWHNVSDWHFGRI